MYLVKYNSELHGRLALGILHLAFVADALLFFLSLGLAEFELADMVLFSRWFLRVMANEEVK